MSTTPDRLVLRQLSLPVRLVLSLFLLSVGLGYTSALVQLHFQQSSRNGEPLPGKLDVIRTFHGDPGSTVGTLERLITAPEKGVPFNGSGSMASAFTTKTEGWKSLIKKRGEDTVRAERAGEKKALLAWVHAGAKRGPYQSDSFPLPPDWGDQPITEEFRQDDRLKIRSIVESRCVRCHTQTGQSEDGAAQSYPLEHYDEVAKYAQKSSGAMSIEKLAQSTHVHLLGFAMLYTLTGLVFALSSWPRWLRVLLAPLPLLAQVADISCWWLARLEGPAGEYFAQAIMVTGAVVAGSLLLQIVLSLWSLYGATGRAVLLVLFLAGGYGAYVVDMKVVQPHLAAEKEEYEVSRQGQAAPRQTEPGKDKEPE